MLSTGRRKFFFEQSLIGASQRVPYMKVSLVGSMIRLLAYMEAFLSVHA